MLKVVVLCDVGQHVYHVGDEAMAHAAAQELESRGISVVMLSRNPSQTRELYGTASASTITFPWSPVDRERYLEEISSVLKGQQDALPPEDQVWDFIQVVKDCDAVLIAGGGNMNSRYGWLLYERAALGLVAAHLGKPLVISGQTLGPALTGKDAEVLSGLLQSAQLVGVRERTSCGLAERLGVSGTHLTAGLDDAAFLTGQTKAPRAAYIAATFAPGSGTLDEDEYFERVAAVLDGLVEASGLGIVFIPHMADIETHDQDLHAHQRIAAAMQAQNIELAELLPAEEAVALTAGASMVVTSRYHPAVFAAAAGIPAVSLSTDHYSDVRLAGAFGNWGLQSFNLPLASLLDGGFRDAALAAWEQREEIADHLRGLAEPRRAEAHDWWNGVVLALGGEQPSAPPSLSPSGEYRADGNWELFADAARRVGNSLGALAAVAELERQREQDLHHQAVRERDEVRAELERVVGSKAFRAASSAWKISDKVKVGRRR